MRLRSLLVLALLVAACDYPGLTVTPLPSGAALASGAGSPTVATSGAGAIEHVTGPTDVVLRFEFIGGFVLPAVLATQAPIFTLYGDGTVIFRNPNLQSLPAEGSVMPVRPFRITRLNEDQVQTVLADALGRGGLRAARTDYSANQIMDLPTAVFTINADGISKRVAITGLGIDIGGTPDDSALAAFLALSARLQDFDNGGAFSTVEYVPLRYRGSLLEGQPGIPDARAWPWTTIAPADFVVDPDPNAFPLPARVLSVDEFAALELTFLYAGGLQGLTLIGPGDGRIYTLSLRPLLPDESK